MPCHTARWFQATPELAEGCAPLTDTTESAGFVGVDDRRPSRSPVEAPRNDTNEDRRKCLKDS
jgi:hypothetical protein